MDCIFCQIAEHKLPANIVYEDDDVVAFHDINPQAPVHVLVIPRKKHIAKIADMTAEDQALVGKVIYIGKQVAEQLGIAEDGFRLVFNNGRHGGQHVYHIHLHVLGGRPMTWPPG
ncbi:MAG: histidine triad nucleotide-binding protein [Calditrichaeota bacterium]|nr:histidine triad nucleotide-binding protein [Calditrichota bacterium]